MRLGKTRALLVVALVLRATFATSVFSLQAATTPPPADPTADFDDIVGGVGFVFAGICEDPRPAPEHIFTEDEKKTTCFQCRELGNCSVDQMLQLLVNVSTLILGLSGSIVLLMFVYGGFLWVTSRGNAEVVANGKHTMTRAVIGFALILGAYSIINFVLGSLTDKDPTTDIIQDQLSQPTGVFTPPTTPTTTTPTPSTP